MANTISPQLIAQLYAQESSDPFLMLVTISHDSFADIRLVNNSENIISRDLTFTAFPMKITLPADDGETVKEARIEFDNVALELIDEIRTVTTPMTCKLELVLASIPDDVQISLEELKIGNVTYNKQRVSARLYLDNFMNTALGSEKYDPKNFPGLF